MGVVEGGVPAVAAQQAGVFTAAQALSDGCTQRVIRRRLATGHWVHVAGWAIAPATQTAWTPIQLAVAARLTWPAAVVSHRVAGLLHGFPLDPAGPVEVIMQGRTRALRGIVVHRLRLDDSEVHTRWPQVRLTSRPRTALDLLSSVDAEAGLSLWAWVSSRNVLTVGDLRAAISRRAKWHGRPRLVELLELVQDGAVSVAEFRLHSLLRRAGITGWEAGARILDRDGLIGVVDLLFPKVKLVVEVDGFRAHSSRRAFATDRRRQNRLVSAGYQVLRFTWSDLTDRPDEVISQILAYL